MLSSLLGSVHIVRPIGEFSPSIDATDAEVIIRHLDFDEAFITPARTPRVLDDPVRNANVVLEAPLLRLIFLAAIPPLINDALEWFRLIIAVIIVAVIIVPVIVVIVIIVLVFRAQVIANDGDSMIQVFAAFIGRFHDTGSNITEVGSAESDVHWLLGNYLFHLFHRSLGKSIVLFDLAHNIAKVMPTFFKFSPFIPIVSFFHGTVVHQEIIKIFHPAALAAPALVVCVFSACVFKMLLVV